MNADLDTAQTQIEMTSLAWRTILEDYSLSAGQLETFCGLIIDDLESKEEYLAETLGVRHSCFCLSDVIEDLFA